MWTLRIAAERGYLPVRPDPPLRKDSSSSGSDEIVISTLPTNMSRWLQADLPRRIERTTGAQVTHVVAQPPKREPATVQLPERQKRGVLAPLSTLTWGPGPNG